MMQVRNPKMEAQIKAVQRELSVVYGSTEIPNDVLKRIIETAEQVKAPNSVMDIADHEVIAMREAMTQYKDLKEEVTSLMQHMKSAAEAYRSSLIPALTRAREQNVSNQAVADLLNWLGVPTLHGIEWSAKSLGAYVNKAIYDGRMPKVQYAPGRRPQDLRQGTARKT